MKAEINKFGEEVAEILTQLAEIEVFITDELEKHHVLTAKLAAIFNGIKAELDKKFALPVHEETALSEPRPLDIREREALRKRFRNLGDVVGTEQVTKDNVKSSDSVISRGKLPPKIKHLHDTVYRFTGKYSTFDFDIGKGYRLLNLGETYGQDDEFIDCSYGPWIHPVTNHQKTIDENIYPMRRKLSTE